MTKRGLAVLITALVLVAGLAIAMFLLIRGERMVVRNPMLTQQPSIITWMEGDVEVTPDAGPEAVWAPAEIGMRLREGDSVRTGAGAAADIRIYDEGLVRLGENTEVKLEELTLRRQNIRIAIGTLFARFHLLFDSQDLRFSTSTSVAAVRGTELIFHVDEQGTRVDALSGITEVSGTAGDGGSILLASRQTTYVEAGSPPTDPVDLAPAAAFSHRRVFNGMNDEEVFLISREIHFQANTAEILPESLPVLDEVAKKLSLRREKILIVGHTADVGAKSGQVSLSEKRAEAIRDELVSRGIAGRRLSTIGYGGSRPVSANDTAEGRAANRRVEFLVIE